MSDLVARLEKLSPKQRKLLELRKAEKLKVPPLTWTDRSGRLPLSFAQQRLWFLAQLSPDSATYNIPIALHVEGDLNREVFMRAVQEIVRRHEVLRTTYKIVDGEIWQQVGIPDALKTSEVDLSGLEEHERHAQAKRIAGREAHQPFDLEQGPPVRVKLLRLQRAEHVVLVTMHHIASDAWSRSVFVREFGMLYQAFCAGKASPLPEMQLQYGDYAVWQREWLKGDLLDRQLDYWKQELADLRPLDWSDYRARPAGPSQRGATMAFAVEKDLTEKLTGLSQHSGATLFMVVLAGFQVLLSKYTGQRDVVVGTAVANRKRVELEGLIGFFVNTLVLRADLNGNPSFQEVLKRVRKTTLGAYQNQDVPFEKLVHELQPERDANHSPFFQVMLVLQNAQMQELRLPGLRLSNFAVEADLAKFDLQLTLNETAEGLIGEVSYACDLYEPATIEQLLRHFRIVLEQMVADPEQRIGEFSLLVGAEREQLLAERVRVESGHPQRCVHELFEEQAARTPNAAAVIYEGESLQYGELNRRANQIAGYLKTRAVGPEVRVALCLERSLEMVEALLGVLKAGGAYVPLDPEYPLERLQFMLEDAQSKVLLTTRKLQKELFATRSEVVCIEDIREEITSDAEVQARKREFPITAHPANAAYVIYTSGSTGRPKGVVVSHGNVMRLMEQTHGWFKFDRQDVWTLFHSYAFDFSVWELWGALLYGGRLVIVPYWVGRSAEDFLGLLVKERVTVLNQTPSAFQQLMRAEEARGIEEDLQLRLIIFGGEALEFQSLRPWLQRHAERPQLVNMYGITETTVHVTYQPVGLAEIRDKAGKSRIGVPIADLHVLVLDADMQLVPVGVRGEIYVGGEGVARGYLNRPELTAERFVPNPYGKVAGERLYRSGDQASWRRDRSLDYFGRLDHQVKIRGFRVELGEIESALRDSCGVRQAAVVLRLVEGGDARLVAYVVPGSDTSESNGSSMSAAQLRESLKQQLPEYMLPSAFVLLNEIPLTANGKVDHKALPEPNLDDGSIGNTLRARNAEEEALCEIFAEVLKRERIGIEQNFFEAGGHSLIAAQTIARVRTVLGVELPLRALFEAPTVAGLAKRVERARRSGKGLEVPPLVKRARRGAEQLSFAQ